MKNVQGGKTIRERNDARSIRPPSSLLMAVSDSNQAHPKNSNHSSSRGASAGNYVGPHESVYPGAVAVVGPNGTRRDDDEFTLTPQPFQRPRNRAAPMLPSMEPVTARLVQGNEDDVEHLQQELERMRRERENVAVAVVQDESTDEEKGDAATGGHQKGAAAVTDQSMAQLCSPRRALIAASAVVLIILAIVLGVVLSQSPDDPATQPPVPTYDEATCVTQTSQLMEAEATTLLTEYDVLLSALTTDLSNNVAEFCSTISTAEFVCEINADEYSANFNAVCKAIGGQAVTWSLAIGCSGTYDIVCTVLLIVTEDDGARMLCCWRILTLSLPLLPLLMHITSCLDSTLEIEMTFANYPICVDTACDPNDLPQEIEQEVDVAVNAMMDEMEADMGGNTTCLSLHSF